MIEEKVSEPASIHRIMECRRGQATRHRVRCLPSRDCLLKMRPSLLIFFQHGLKQPTLSLMESSICPGEAIEQAMDSFSNIRGDIALCSPVAASFKKLSEG